ncbi:ATP-binding cassette domain-containing protein [Limimaricola pyoseonensis]|uniref:Thiamine transport system ATP-binding protein n=1 Tax=Limimaricola pyoseonensis TaxID=521013 RepID=A0A1G7EWP0_9RHOB|nr:ATP-binding cassette domain-containing protein [Limimaricola pyoseonensis]SDE68089.1 thiamine transport system ATP-binding protein [Limimaricola pyoseonensis]
MLRLEGLEIRQDDFALSADWSLDDGAICAVMGPSGGGKSTLLSVIAGFLAPTRGRVVWDGRDLTGLPPAVRPISILFQDNNLFPHLTVERNLGLGLDPRLRLDANQKARIAEVLARVGLAGLGDRKPGALSGGQQSRAALARVLLMDRPLVLLDEPFAALGPGLRAEMLDLAREVLAGPGRTLLMVSHAPEDAARIADRIVLVGEGRAAPPGEAQALLADPPPALRAYLGL